MNKLTAGIDIGSNSARLMIVDITDGKIIHQQIMTTRLGEDLADSQKLSFQSLNRTFIAVSELCRISREQYKVGKIRAFCTEAVRKARNRSELIDRIQKNLDVEVEIIAGEKEAEFVFKGVYHNHKISLNLNNTLIVDIGGGSTEFIYIKEGNIEFLKSIDMGALMLSKKYLQTDPPKAEEFNKMEDDILSRLGFLENIIDCKLIGLGGSITTLSALNMNLKVYKSDIVDGSKLTLRRCKKLLWDLRSVPDDERKNIISFDPERSDIIISGAAILVNVMEQVLAKSVTVSETGILYGYIMEEFHGNSD